MQIVIVVVHALFLSTLSLRRATEEKSLVVSRPLRISIHALLAESDPVSLSYRWTSAVFLSTLSLRRATNGTHY